MAKMNFDDGIKPLHVPAAFGANNSLEEQTVYALAYLQRATTARVVAKLSELNPKMSGVYETEASAILEELYRQGWINGVEGKEGMEYNLDKEVVAHTGNVDPEEIV